MAHKKNKHMLFCMLTKQPLSRQPRTVEGHVNGKRYKRLRKEHEEQGLGPGEKPKRLTKEEKRAAQDEMRRFALGADICIGVGVSAAAVGLVMLLVSGGDEADGSAAVGPLLGPGQVGAQLMVRFP